MAMDEGSWKRHASPWSVWTRIPIGPALIVAIYARQWIGWWSLIAIAVILAWNWWNPRAFPPPQTLDSGSARGVMGERIFLERNEVPIPWGVTKAAYLLTSVSLLGVPPLAYGLWTFHPWATALGAVLTIGGKIWFVDRMAWLYDKTPESQRPA